MTIQENDMQIINLYKYERADGGITVSPNKPDVAYTEMYRLVADEGKVLTNDGEHFTSCADVDSIDGWYEVDAPEETE
jgi:hypothetical protein